MKGVTDDHREDVTCVGGGGRGRATPPIMSRSTTRAHPVELIDQAWRA
jgi:hypothetical protein